MTSLVVTQDIFWEAAKKKIPFEVVEYLGIGVTTVANFNLDRGIVWNRLTGGGREQIYPEGLTPGKVTVVSTSALDAAAGVGAQTLLLKGNNATNDEFLEEVVALNGTTAVFSANDYSFVSGLTRINTVGTDGQNAGLITCSLAGSVVAHLEPGFMLAAHAFLTLPTTVTGFIFSLNYSSRITSDFLSQIAAPGMPFVDIDRQEVAGGITGMLPVDRNPIRIPPGGSFRVIPRSIHMHNKFRVSAKVAFIKTALL